MGIIMGFMPIMGIIIGIPIPIIGIIIGFIMPIIGFMPIMGFIMPIIGFMPVIGLPIIGLPIIGLLIIGLPIIGFMPLPIIGFIIPPPIIGLMPLPIGIIGTIELIPFVFGIAFIMLLASYAASPSPQGSGCLTGTFPLLARRSVSLVGNLSVATD